MTYSMLLPGVIGLLLVGFLYRADFERYNIFTIGVFKRVERAPAVETDHDCSELYCEKTVTDGEKRTRFKEIVVCGCPIRRYAVGSLYCCEGHVSFEFQQGEHETTTHRLQESIISAIVTFNNYSVAMESTVEETEFQEVETAVNDVFQLASVALVVLAIVVFTVPLRRMN